ncbi:hypothetical protein GD627_03880 [Arthrobacter yangruifuii]|uniref:Uncharacterized protein n=1 Tax=Arthrobacter yangruifuii TaxID=2606616 RepID=A0A5N6MTU0_9MICC|nr:hypothetical protein [Arthrobacter yangruifuii]KAD4060206.1 hypothetical protein GD627_03880 [Arthrobacter yangruifuii]
MTEPAELLLEGPRGRRLCLELAAALDEDIGSAVFWLGYELDPGKGTSRVLFGSADPAERPSPEHLAGTILSLDLRRMDDEQICAALQRSVDSARYWQAPEGEDALAALPVIRRALQPLAERVLDTRAAQAWDSPGTPEQWSIDWRPAEDPAPLPRNPRGILQKWGEAVRAEEAQAERDRPQDPRAAFSGTWWSAPLGLVRTAGQIPAGLSLVEDSAGLDEATVIPVSGIGRILDIRSPADWMTLCRAYPLEVTASRRHNWFQTTGRIGRWVIPDWERAAGQWDAVHLTVLGYLRSAGRALDVDAGTASVIAGWDPDSTLWLTDRAREVNGPRQVWRRSEDTWIRVA